MDVLAPRMTNETTTDSNPNTNRTLTNTTNLKQQQQQDDDQKNPNLKQITANSTFQADLVIPYSSRPLSYRPYRSYNGRARPSNNIQFKEQNIQSYTDANGVVYKVADHVYMDINKPNQPFAIAYILDFKLVILFIILIRS